MHGRAALRAESVSDWCRCAQIRIHRRSSMCHSRPLSLSPALLLALRHAVSNQFTPARLPAAAANVAHARWHRSRCRNFSFGTGETLPELKLHYLTLGTPHRNAAGHVDNAVLLLHGTGGNAHSLLNPDLLGCAVCAGRHSRYSEILHHPAGRHRARAEFQALRRHAHALSLPTTTTTWCAASA